MLINGDCLKELEKLDSDSIDLIVTDPPYGYNFMGKDWDKAVPSVDVWHQCLRVLKAGAFCMVMSSPRQDVLAQMIVRLQQAGFRTDFTSIYWTYASGFPKAGNISKLASKRGIDYKSLTGSYAGFQPKPAVEIVLVTMKPFFKKTFVDQALDNQKGITWFDDCRIPYQDNTDMNNAKWYNQTGNINDYNKGMGDMGNKNVLASSQGRYPANLLVSDDILNDNCDYSRYFDIDKWFKTTYPFAIIPKASSSERNKGCNNITPNYITDKNKWSENDYRKGDGSKTTQPKNNNHPTVKPVKLMAYLVTLASRPNDTVLDPYAGSGTTLIAAQITNRKHIGIELNKEYCEIAQARLTAWI